MPDLHGVPRKLYISIEIFLAYKILVKISYLFGQNCLKMMKMTKTLMSIFPEDYRYYCNCFPRLFYTPWAISQPNIMAVNMILQKLPLKKNAQVLTDFLYLVSDMSKSPKKRQKRQLLTKIKGGGL